MINAAKEMEENGDLTPKESNKIIKLKVQNIILNILIIIKFVQIHIEPKKISGDIKTLSTG